MPIEELVKICKKRKELRFLYLVTKIVAESDSIGDEYPYCKKYSHKDFNNANSRPKEESDWKKNKYEGYCPYLEKAGIRIYELYLKHIGVLDD